MIRGILWSWLPYIYNKTTDSFNLIKRIVTAAYNEVVIDKEWIILKNNNIPIYSVLFPNTPTASIKWSCQINPPIFTDPNCLVSNSRHISYLGFVVNISGYDPIDITEWINTVQWNGNLEPSLLDIFTLWCCETGNSYFHLAPIVSVDLITELGDSITKGLNDSATYTSSRDGNIRHNENNSLGSDPIRVMDTILSSGGC